MKEDIGGKSVSAKPSLQKIFGTNSLQIAGDDTSPLVGSIVEKGISEEPQSRPLAIPRPTVFPFPVARHRSHGPHWAPKGSGNSDGGDEGDDDKDSAESDLIAVFANPVQRKQKKGLDFGQWQQLINGDNFSVYPEKGTYKSLSVESMASKKLSSVSEISDHIDGRIEAKNGPLSREMYGENNAKAQDVDVEKKMDLASSEDMPQNAIPETPACVMENLEPRLLEVSKRKRRVGTEKTSVPHITANAASNKFEQGSIGLESQIDAENSARLQRMSADEIAEAQAEILDRINPAVIEALRKRGQEKLKKKTISRSDVATKGVVDYVQNEEKLSKDTKDSPLSQVDNSCKVTTPASIETLQGQDHNAMGNSKPGSCTLWDVWCKRVEAVRELRFSLDGNVIENDLSSVPETGSVSVDSGYTAYNVSERDFLRTEGNPGAAGYTIKEALALSRSVIPGQRTIALHLLASVLDRALHNLTHNQVGCNMKDARIDWEAIWAFALGPEPELALSIRMCLDDNHKSVVLACAKVIQCILCCDINESFFDTSEKTATYPKDVYTAPVFRSRQGIDVGFLRGGFWKYSAKPSNILPFDEDIVTDKTEGEHTIQDDIVVAGQDFAAGLVRMGILTRICYLLETDPSAALEESIISILIAIARHSPTCSNAIIKCQRLVQTIVDMFTMKDQVEITPSKIKSVILLKVLAQSEKKNCIEFIENGIFQKATWHLYRHTFSLDQWVQLGVENKLSLTLMVEQLRFWRVFIQHGYCVSNFSDMFPVLCVWLNVPSFEKLKKNDILGEFAAIATEAYLVLEALTRRLPNFYSHLHQTSETAESVKEDMDTWFWSEVGPMVDLAIEWTAFRSNPYIAKFFDYEIGSISDFPIQSLPVGPLLWVISAVMHMLSSLLKRVIPEDTIGLVGEYLPWLPEFVPKIGLEIIKNGFLSFSGLSGTENEKDQSGSGSFIRLLCHLRHQGEHETSIAAVCCLNGIVEVVVSVDKLIKLSKPVIHPPPSQNHNFMGDDMILANGLCESAVVEFKSMLSTFMELIASEWHDVHSIEAFGRGGPAPGVGLGWGFSGGGFWSTGALLAQTDARLLIHLLKIFQIVSSKDPPTVEEMDFIVQKLNSIFGVCSIAGPRDGFIVDMALGILLEVPVLKCLDLCIRRFLCQNKELKLFEWEYNEEDYHLCSKILASHFRKRWLCVKRKSKVMDRNTHAGRKTSKKNSGALDTIHEDFDTSGMTSQDHCCTSLVVEWAHQKLPLPMHWFLSPISTIGDTKHADLPGASDILNDVRDITHFLEVAKCGIFFLLGVEAISSLLPIEIHSTVRSVPIVWKLHSLSMVLLVGMGVLEEERSRVVYETLQEIYGQLLDESRFKKRTQFILEKSEFSAETGGRCSEEFLSFQSEIHESYSTFMEALVEQFAAISYGDLIYGRQVAIYLHRCVEGSVRLATWTALSNARVLELLPPLEKCFANAEGYLEPVEDNESILEAYVKSWVSGALDRAATRKSITFTLVLHHLSSFIFGRNAANLLLRNKLVKSLLRDYSRKQQHEAMMVDLIQYNKPLTSKKPGQEGGSSVEACDIEKRFNLMADSCERNSSLLSVVEKLKSSFQDNNLLQAW